MPAVANRSSRQLGGVLSGASLAQKVRRLSPAERALVAADILDGNIILMNLTAKAIAQIVGCGYGSVFAALRLTPEQREAVRHGDRPLVEHKARMSAPMFDWNKIADEELAEGVRAIGVDRVLAVAAHVDAHPAH